MIIFSIIQACSTA